ncbi:MAG: hypothetical protein ACLSH7_07410 [Veillonella parvula]
MTDTTRPKRYRMVSKYYKETYGEKVYKLPVALPLTCPNRDGPAGVGGCTFCGEIGAGYENRPAWMTVRMQLGGKYCSPEPLKIKQRSSSLIIKTLVIPI